jgi:group I intron endonuclease
MHKQTYLVYKITNIINDKSYIGITSQSLNKRWQNHLYCIKKGRNRHSPLYNAISKYGKENFSIFPIFSAFSWKDLLTIESVLIEQNRTFIDRGGYNLTKGGEGTVGWVPPQEYRDKLSKIGTGRKHTAETRKKMSEATTGPKNSRFGHKASIQERLAIGLRSKIANSKPEVKAKQKASLVHTGRIKGTKQSHFITFKGETRIAREWAEITGINEVNICKRIKRGWSVEDVLTIPVQPGNRIKPVPNEFRRKMSCVVTQIWKKRKERLNK